MFHEILPINAEGHVKIDYRDPSTGEVVRTENFSNLVVSLSREIIRDLLFDPSAINKLENIKLGDMNMRYGDDVSNLPPPSITDTDLVNAFYETSAHSLNRGVTNGRPSLSITFLIPAQSANDPNSSIRLITELGLYTNNMKMFSRIVRPLYKTQDTDMYLEWTITL